MPSDIPLARQRLTSLAHDMAARSLPFEASAILRIVNELMIRDSAVRRAPDQRKSVTRTIRERVKAYVALKSSRGIPLADIGKMFGIDGGRVSEIIRGQWDHLQ